MVARPECRNIEVIEARGEAEQSGMERETGNQLSRMALTNCYGKHREGNLTVIGYLTLC